MLETLYNVSFCASSRLSLCLAMFINRTLSRETVRFVYTKGLSKYANPIVFSETRHILNRCEAFELVSMNVKMTKLECRQSYQSKIVTDTSKSENKIRYNHGIIEIILFSVKKNIRPSFLAMV